MSSFRYCDRQGDHTYSVEPSLLLASREDVITTPDGQVSPSLAEFTTVGIMRTIGIVNRYGMPITPNNPLTAGRYRNYLKHGPLSKQLSDAPAPPSRLGAMLAFSGEVDGHKIEADLVTQGETECVAAGAGAVIVSGAVSLKLDPDGPDLYFGFKGFDNGLASVFPMIEAPYDQSNDVQVMWDRLGFDELAVLPSDMYPDEPEVTLMSRGSGQVALRQMDAINDLLVEAVA